MKTLLCAALVLAAPRFDQPLKVQVDTIHLGRAQSCCRNGRGSIGQSATSQKSFKKHQFNDSRIEKEALSLIWALQHFDVISGIIPVVVYTTITCLLVFVH